MRSFIFYLVYQLPQNEINFLRYHRNFSPLVKLVINWTFWTSWVSNCIDSISTLICIVAYQYFWLPKVIRIQRSSEFWQVNYHLPEQSQLIHATFQWCRSYISNQSVFWLLYFVTKHKNFKNLEKSHLWIFAPKITQPLNIF